MFSRRNRPRLLRHLSFTLYTQECGRMKIALFYHSLVSDWNHGNAHFLRGVASELQSRGHKVRIFEPENSWSRENLLQDRGPEALDAFERAFPNLTSTRYSPDALNLDKWLDGI